MRASGPRKWSGQLYDYDDGRNYQGHIIEQGQNNIRIEGCSIGICGGENLVRANERANAAVAALAEFQ